MQEKTMSEEQAQSKGLRLIPVWWPVVTAIAASLVAGGSTYATTSYAIAEMREKVKEQEKFAADARDRLARLETHIESIDRGLTRIDGKLDALIQKQ